jgi:pyruvate carboxylase subunit B
MNDIDARGGGPLRHTLTTGEERSVSPLKITDVTMRDGQQSLMATRMRTEDMVKIAPEMDRAGFYSMEVWGGATFDTATRFLNEDPWDRPRALKKLLPNTPLQMLLRGQNLVGYRHYADDVVDAFVAHAAEAGIDIFRIFDALNDERNLERSVAAVKKAGKHAQLCVCYTLTGPKMGGPIFNLDYFLNKAHILQQMGADSICIKDMAGLLAPDDAFVLVSALKKELKVPLQLHTHCSSGMAPMTVLKAVEAGVDIIDAALAPFASRSAPPAVEPVVGALRGTGRDTGLDLQHLLKLGEYFESIAPKYRSLTDTSRMATIDPGVLVHQIPGGMISNLVMQLTQLKKLDRLHEVFEEMPRTRKELGYPPLVTPTSQIVGVQALYNATLGRYKQLTREVMDYCYGLYGKPPAPVDPEVLEQVLRHYKKGRMPITVRPADLLEPEMDNAREMVRDFTQEIGDILTAAIYPITGLHFLKWKYGLEKAAASPRQG